MPEDENTPEQPQNATPPAVETPAAEAPAQAAPTQPGQPSAPAPVKPVQVELPKLVFGTDVQLPEEPKNGDQKIQSMVGEAGRQKAFDKFKEMWGRAGKREPILDDVNGGDKMAQYKAARAQHRKNPLTSTYKRLEAEYHANVKSQGQPAAEQIYKSGAQEAMNAYMNGIDRGKDDPALGEHRKNAFQKLMQLDFQGAMFSFVQSIPFVGEWINAAWRSMTSFFTGERISIAEAKEQIRVERAYGGAAQALAIFNEEPSPKEEAMVNEGRTTIATPGNAAAAASQGAAVVDTSNVANVPLDKSFVPSAFDVNTPLGAKVAEQLRSKQVVASEDGTYYATSKAVSDLDALSATPGTTPQSQPVPGTKIESSWSATK